MGHKKCSKHGVLSGHEILMWKGRSDGVRWCMHCYNEMMTKLIKLHCDSELTEISDDK